MKERDGTLNSIAIGVISGFLLAKYTALEIWLIAVILGVVVFVLHRFIDIFLALEEASEEELL